MIIGQKAAPSRIGRKVPTGGRKKQTTGKGLGTRDVRRTGGTMFPRAIRGRAA